jgi:hypothetical protein
MDIVVERCFPVGWVDQKPDGEPPGEPRGDKEERVARRQWEVSAFTRLTWSSRIC